MMPVLLALLVLLPSTSARHYEDPDPFLVEAAAIMLDGQIVHSPWTGDSYVLTPDRGAVRLKRSRLPCPNYLVNLIGERFLAAKSPRAGNETYRLWYHFPGDTGWVPVDWVAPCYLVPDWEAWRADQVRVDKELKNLRLARDEYQSWWERH